MLPRLSLRARLLLGVLVLASAGLLVADTITYTSLRSFLLDRVDSTLDADHQGAERARFGPGAFGGGPRFGGPGGLGADYVQFRASNGKQVLYTPGVGHFYGTTAPPPPKLPTTITVPLATADGGPDRVNYFTVPATSGGDRWRVRASIDPGSPTMLVLATSLSDVDGTLHLSLIHI